MTMATQSVREEELVDGEDDTCNAASCGKQNTAVNTLAENTAVDTQTRPLRQSRAQPCADTGNNAAWSKVESKLNAGTWHHVQDDEFPSVPTHEDTKVVLLGPLACTPC